MTTKLPAPEPIAQQHSDQLTAYIKQKIAEAGGKITFAEYMHYCLYTPGLGYYSAGSHKLGEQGDFTTAPEISPQSSLPNHYFIIEASADLQNRQEKLITDELPHLLDSVVWLTQLPEQFVGVIVANEVCDAMPVHRLHFSKRRVQERYISYVNNEFQWCDDELSQAALIAPSDEVQALIGDSEMVTEVNLASQAWLTSIADSLEQGAVFIIDYGHPKASYYHPQRSDGTLMCYYQHQGHNNPLILQGLQDITAHVDFTRLAQVAIDNGLDVDAFQSQADFLLAGGITELANQLEEADTLALFTQATAIKRLTLPSEMGETFKVLTLSRNLGETLPRCQLGDRRYSL